MNLPIQSAPLSISDNTVTEMLPTTTECLQVKAPDLIFLYT